MLTRKQRELLLFINQRLTATGVSPSFDEMKDALHLRSKSGIHRLVSGLEERGFIRRLPHRALRTLPRESLCDRGNARSLQDARIPMRKSSGQGKPMWATRCRCSTRRSPSIIKAGPH